MRPACLRLGEGPVDAQIGGAEAVAQNAVAGHIPDFMAAVQIGYPSAGEIQGQRAIHQRRAHVLFQPVIHGVVDEIMVFQPAPAQLSGGRAFVHLLKMAGQPFAAAVGNLAALEGAWQGWQDAVQGASGATASALAVRLMKNVYQRLEHEGMLMPEEYSREAAYRQLDVMQGRPNLAVVHVLVQRAACAG